MDEDSQRYGMQWTTLTSLCKSNLKVKDGINEFYAWVTLPYKIRSHFATWIESQLWTMDLDCEAGRRKAENLYKELIMMIDEQQSRVTNAQAYDLEKSLDWHQTKDTLTKNFDGNYVTFVEVVRKCLEKEQELIQAALTPDDTNLKRKNPNGRNVSLENVDLSQKQTDLRQQIAAAERNLHDVRQKQDEFYSDYLEKMEKVKMLEMQVNSSNQPASKAELTAVMNSIRSGMQKGMVENQRRRIEMTLSYMSLSRSLVDILGIIWGEIENWHDEQKHAIAMLVNPKAGTLDYLDKLCDEAVQMLISLIIQVNTAVSICQSLIYQNDRNQQDLEKLLNGLVSETLENHMKRILVVERNITDRVLRVSSGKSLGFSMTLRLLGGNGLGLSSNPPKVQMSLFLDKDIPPGDTYMEGACQIQNGHERTFSINRGTNSYVAQFQSVMLKSVKRPEKGKNEEALVTEHKFAFVFYTSLSVCGRQFNIKLISLPVILTSQTSQEIMAKGTLIWDAAFSDRNRQPFVCRESVLWSEVASVLDKIFKNNTGRGLDKERLDYLARMALRYREPKRGENRMPLENFDNENVTEKQVIRDRLPGRDFSFWKWVYACMNLVRQHVNTEWRDGHIVGFISKESAKRKLSDAPIGTFLLRFSETSIESSQRADISGSLTLAVMEMDPKSGEKKLFHIRDYLCPKEVSEKGLSPILLAMEVAEYANPGRKKPLLRHLWPNTNKTFQDVFGHYIEQREKADDGYRRGRFIVEIFLHDEQAPRQRMDSVSTDCSITDISNPASVQSNLSMPSPCAFDQLDLSDYASTNFSENCNSIDMLQPSLPSLQRRTVAVRPFVPTDQPQGIPMHDSVASGARIDDYDGFNFANLLPTMATHQTEPTYDEDGDMLWRILEINGALTDLQSQSSTEN